MTKEERIKKYGEVFTPQYIVEDMCNMLRDNNTETDVFGIENTFLEPSCGDGVFILEILRRKFAHCEKRADYTACLNSVYGMELQENNVKACIENVIALCQEYFKPTKKELDTINDHIILCDSLKVMRLLSHDWKEAPIIYVA